LDYIINSNLPLNLYVNLQWLEIEVDRERCSKNEIFMAI